MRLTLTRTYNTVLIIIIVHLTLFPLCLILLVPTVTSTVSLCSFYICRLIGKLTTFLQIQEFIFHNQPFTTVSRRSPHSSSLSKVGHILVKSVVLRINLNIDGESIPSRSYTYPSHSQTSRLLTSSLFLGVPVPRVT